MPHIFGNSVASKRRAGGHYKTTAASEQFFRHEETTSQDHSKCDPTKPCSLCDECLAMMREAELATSGWDDSWTRMETGR